MLMLSIKRPEHCRFQTTLCKASDLDLGLQYLYLQQLGHTILSLRLQTSFDLCSVPVSVGCDDSNSS